jgi:hypothetical protein
VRYNSVIKEYRKFTNEELELHKKQQYSRILFNGIALIISIGLLFYLYISKKNKLNAKEKVHDFINSLFKVHLHFNNSKTFFNSCILQGNLHQIRIVL